MISQRSSPTFQSSQSSFRPAPKRLLNNLDCLTWTLEVSAFLLARDG
jgi:hypothetical protein